MLTNLLLLVLVVLAAVLLYAATRPGTFRIERKTRVQASPATIFPLLDDLRSGERWSPYYRKDPAMKTRYSGPDRGVGSTFEFEGDPKQVGSGKLTVTGVSPDAQVRMRLQMFKPMAADNVVEFTLTPQDATATEVSWAMSGRQPLLGRIMCLFFNMDRMVGEDFETGLANLKTLAETRR